MFAFSVSVSVSKYQPEASSNLGNNSSGPIQLSPAASLSDVPGHRQACTVYTHTCGVYTLVRGMNDKQLTRLQSGNRQGRGQKFLGVLAFSSLSVLGLN